MPWQAYSSQTLVTLVNLISNIYSLATLTYYIPIKATILHLKKVTRVYQMSYYYDQKLLLLQVTVVLYETFFGEIGVEAEYSDVDKTSIL